MIELLENLFKKYNIEYTEDQLVMLKKYYNIVLEQNKVMNLTNITDKTDFAIKNILDSVLPIKIIPKNSTVVDVGAGAGFPSIPLKILRDDLNFVLVDSLNKRVNFLNNAIKILGLKNIKAVHLRAEELAQKSREGFDVVVSRAVAKLNTLLEYCLPLIKVGGKMIAYKSLKAEEEIIESKKALEVLGGKIVNKQNVFIKEIDSIRINVVINKFKPTPKEYPRTKNLPKTKPII